MKEIILKHYKKECDYTFTYYKLWREHKGNLNHELWREHTLKKEALYNVLREAGYTIDELVQIELKAKSGT